jgi:hypothetical protein
MTARHLVHVDPGTLERIAFNTDNDIEVDAANDRAFLRVGTTTFVAELAPEPTC